MIRKFLSLSGLLLIGSFLLMNTASPVQALSLQKIQNLPTALTTPSEPTEPTISGSKPTNNQAATKTVSDQTTNLSLADRLKAAFSPSISTQTNSSASNQASATGPLSYGGGVYTNLCGTGTAATADTCNAGCNPYTGSCSSTTASVVRYVCDGRLNECRQNESGFSTSQSVAGVSCGKTVQLDVYTKNCRADGGWSCSSSDLKDYMVWYSGDCAGSTPPPSENSCDPYRPLNTQFRRSGESSWVSGSQLRGLMAGDVIDINCFAKNGTDLLPGAQIIITLPNQTQQTFSGAELRSYLIQQTGSTQVSCNSTTIANCQDSDSFYVNSKPAPTPLVSPRPTPTPSPTPSPSPTPDHLSSCDDLSVVGGDNSLVPAKVTLRSRASDNLGSIQKYKYYFGDGQQLETSDVEVQHTYESSGTFTARVDIKDSQGNWKTSNACEAQVIVKGSSIESHKSECSDVFISADNGAMAPSTVTFDVNGYDNKGDLQAYRVDTGTGQTLEESDDKLEWRYTTAGTYTIRAYIKDSQGNWQGGNDGCQRTLYISTEPLTTQPSTGTATWFTVSGLVTTGLGIGLELVRRKVTIV